MKMSTLSKSASKREYTQGAKKLLQIICVEVVLSPRDQEVLGHNRYQMLSMFALYATFFSSKGPSSNIIYIIKLPLQLISSSDVGQSGIPSHRVAQVFPSLHSNLPIALQIGPAKDVYTKVQVNITCVFHFGNK